MNISFQLLVIRVAVKRLRGNAVQDQFFPKWFFCCCIILLIAPNLFSQGNDQTLKDTSTQSSVVEERVLRQLQLMESWPQTEEPIDYEQVIYEDLKDIGKIASNMKSDRLMKAIIDFPVYNPDVGEAKMWALSGFKDDSAARACVIEALQSPEPKIQINAAHVLFTWGEWDLAVPLIQHTGEYWRLGVSKSHLDPRVIPILQDGAQTSPTWEGRGQAAYYLQFFGDTATAIAVDRDIIAHAPLNTDDSSIARAKYTALRTLARCHVMDIVPDILRLASDQSTLVRLQAVDLLQLYAANGIEEARQALETVAAENSDPDLRETAKAALHSLGMK